MSRAFKKPEECPFIFGHTAWKKSDAAWFRSHRRRSFRLRDIFLGEFPAALLIACPAALTHVLVCQVEPGIRQNVFTSKSVARGVNENNNDRLLGLWITLHTTGMRTPSSIMPASEVCQ